MSNMSINRDRMKCVNTAAIFDTTIILDPIREVFEYRKLAAIDILRSRANEYSQADVAFDIANSNIKMYFGII